jgi:hypothetical protein
MTQEIKNHIKNLILKYYYLPFAHITDLKTSTLCDNLDCIKNRAVEILTSETETAEIYRQLIFMLSTQNVIMNSTNSYILALIKARTLRDPFEPYAKLQAEINRKAWWRKEGYRKAVKAYADLIQLNFAYTPPEHVINNFLEPDKKPTQKKILIATLQSKALIGSAAPFPKEGVRNGGSGATAD